MRALVDVRVRVGKLKRAASAGSREFTARWQAINRSDDTPAMEILDSLGDNFKSEFYSIQCMADSRAEERCEVCVARVHGVHSPLHSQSRARKTPILTWRIETGIGRIQTLSTARSVHVRSLAMWARRWRRTGERG